jgi:hypothetical protein
MKTFNFCSVAAALDREPETFFTDVSAGFSENFKVLGDAVREMGHEVCVGVGACVCVCVCVCVCARARACVCACLRISLFRPIAIPRSINAGVLR